jgi:hypothetical protein
LAQFSQEFGSFFFFYVNLRVTTKWPDAWKCPLCVYSTTDNSSTQHRFVFVCRPLLEEEKTIWSWTLLLFGGGWCWANAGESLFRSSGGVGARIFLTALILLPLF